MLIGYEFMHLELLILGPIMRLHLCVDEKWSKHFLFLVDPHKADE